jgi:hypothetical protein
LTKKYKLIWSPCPDRPGINNSLFHFEISFKPSYLDNGLHPLAGLPDGIFPNQKSQFGKILEGLGMEKVDIFYGHLE